MPLLQKKGRATRTKATLALCDETHPFFTLPRDHLHCESKRPSEEVVRRTGDYSKSWWMRSFWDGTIDLSLQTDNEGCVILIEEDAERVHTFNNPLRDPLVIVKRDEIYSLKDGFHRLCEAFARGYNGWVWSVVLDMDIDSDADNMDDD